MLSRILTILIALLLAACQSSVAFTPESSPPLPPQEDGVSPTGEPPDPGQNPTLPGTIQPAPEEIPAGPGENAETNPAAVRAKYSIKAAFNYSYHSLTVEETIAYTNNSTETLDELLLLVEAANYPETFKLTGAAWEGGEPIEGHSLDGRKLLLPLRLPLAPGEIVQFSLTYELRLPQIPEPDESTRPQPFGYTWRQANLVDWYPFVPPYQAGEGWIAHNPWYFAEHQVYEKADYEVTIELIDPPENLVIAASAPGEETASGRFYRLDNARTFVFSASTEYKTASTTVDGVEVNSYFFAYDTPAGEQALQDTADALRLYSQIFGAYPHKSLSVVEADFLDGMEYEGLYFLSRGFYNLYEGTRTGYLTIIAVHETAHQWWYGAVGNDQAIEPWLDEAMCTYSEYLFYEHTDPSLTGWWWDFRVNFYNPEGKIDGRIYDYVGFLFYRNAVYLRGAQFLHDLRSEIGDETFFAFLQFYVQQQTGKISTQDDFFRILSESGGANVEALVSGYFSEKEEGE